MTGPPPLPPFELGDSGTELRRALVEAVLVGRKTSTSSLRIDYAPHTTEPLPAAGERSTLLGLDDEPVGVIETIGVMIAPACAVDAAFVRDEGEGFETVAEWRAAHERFWISNGTIEELTDDMLIVCERFRLIERIA
jgi:uncharacterized protein YhfF